MGLRTVGGRYRMEDVLGRGGMAQVYLGTDSVLGRPVAIKVLAAQYAEDAGFVARFRREAQAAARLNHPNLVGVYDTGSDDGTHYIIMEYVDGRTLAEYLSGGGRLMPERAIELAESVCAALEYAHEHGVIHRDIKPGNIMVTRQGEVKVTDFGIARVATAESELTIAQTAAVLGTASYLSPEQAEGKPVDARSDLYSLGVVLYEMLTGRVPFSGDSPVTVAYKHVQEAPRPPSQLNPDVSPALESVVMRALSKNPDNRYQSAEELRRDLERARRGQPVEATPLLPASAETRVIHRGEGPPTSVLPPEERRNWLPWVLVGLLVLAILGAGLWLLARSLLQEEEVPQVRVPNVVDEQLEDAERILQDAGLEVGEPERVPTTDVEPGTVLEQDPSAGEMVDEGTLVTLAVARGPDLVAIPPVAGQPGDEALQALEEAGFTVLPQEEASDAVEEGFAIRTDPPEGTEVEPESEVTLFISSGSAQAEVPDVVCLSPGAARARLRAEGLNAVESNTAPGPNDLCPNGRKVVSQDPAAGTTVEAGSDVTLFFFLGPPSPSPSPDGDGDGDEGD